MRYTIYMKIKKVFLIGIAILFCIIGILTAFMSIFPNLNKSGAMTAQAIEETAQGMQQPNTLNGMTVDQIAHLSKYDGRDYNIVPAVKDQGSSNLCWAYSSNNVAEISILRSGITPTATKDNLSFSPRYLGKSVFERGADPLKNVTGFSYPGNWESSPGTFLYTADAFAQWCAPIVNNETADMTNWYTKSCYRLLDALEYNYSNGTADTMTPIIKQAVAKYGAVAAGITYSGRRMEYYNPKYMSGGIGHAITIIGWDDSISKDLFKPKAADRDGAWIIKNSYNDDQFFYVSYESTFRQFMALNFVPKEAYTYNYFYDSAGSKAANNVGGNRPSNVNKACNIFEAKSGATGIAEYIQAVNVHLPQRNTTCKVQIYTNLKNKNDPTSGQLATEQTQTFDIAGYRTLQLQTPVFVQRGSYFAVAVDVSATANAKITFSNQIAQNSFNCDKWGDWNKSTTGIPRIKAYTTTKQDSSVVAIDIADTTTTQISMPYTSIAYNGIKPQPIPEVVCKGVSLVHNQDFTVSYEYNDRPGSVNVWINGINRYYGERFASFRIEKGEKPTIDLNTINVEQNTTLQQYANLLPSNWKWQTPNLILNGNITSAVAEYIGNDKQHYKNNLHTIAIHYNNSTPTPPVDPTPPIPPVNPTLPVDPIVPTPPVNPTPPTPPVIPTPPNDNNSGNTGALPTPPLINVPSGTKKSIVIWWIVGIGGGITLCLVIILLRLFLRKRK